MNDKIKRRWLFLLLGTEGPALECWMVLLKNRIFRNLVEMVEGMLEVLHRGGNLPFDPLETFEDLGYSDRFLIHLGGISTRVVYSREPQFDNLGLYDSGYNVHEIVTPFFTYKDGKWDTNNGKYVGFIVAPRY